MKTVRVSPDTVIASCMPVFYHKRTLFVKIFTIKDEMDILYHLNHTITVALTVIIRTLQPQEKSLQRFVDARSGGN